MRALIDRLVGAASRLVLRIYFRDIEVVGRRRLPPAGTPFVVVANHVNGLVDPLFVLGTLRIPARLLGKSTLWKIPVLAQILDLAGVIPVYRRQDAGVDTSRNREAFDRSHVVLAKGGAIAIFPEGTSHDQPQLQPLRTGAARILLEAEERYGPLGARVVPVGLLFEQRERFRSRALVVVGEPIDPAEEVALQRADPVTAARLLTERVTEALERVTLNYESWEEAQLVERGARLLEVDALELPAERRLRTEFESRRDLMDGLAWLRAEHPGKVADAVAAARDYDRLLRESGLRDDQVIARYPLDRIAAFLGRQLFAFAIAAPLALLGTAIYAIPYFAIHLLARRVRHEPNQVATYKIFPGIVIYPGWTIGAAALAHHFAGAHRVLAALATLALLPLAGFVALRFHERLERLVREGRAFLRLRGRADLAAELRAARERVRERIGDLLELWVGEQAFDPLSRNV